MLALLLQRTLEQSLAGQWSANAALEVLATTHLNRYTGSDGSVAHVVTRTDAAQTKSFAKPWSESHRRSVVVSTRLIQDPETSALCKRSGQLGVTDHDHINVIERSDQS